MCRILSSYKYFIEFNTKKTTTFCFFKFLYLYQKPSQFWLKYISTKCSLAVLLQFVKTFSGNVSALILFQQPRIGMIKCKIGICNFGQRRKVLLVYKKDTKKIVGAEQKKTVCNKTKASYRKCFSVEFESSIYLDSFNNKANPDLIRQYLYFQVFTD